jgi:hypothetical protein
MPLAAITRVDLHCKVVKASEAGELEAAVNRFLEEEVGSEGEAQIEAITQSEGPHGVTVLIWYSLVEEQDLDFEERVEQERYT